MGSDRSDAARQLRRNLVVSIVGGILLTAGIAILALSSGARSLLHQEMERRAESDARALALALAAPLERGQLHAAGEALQEVADLPDLVEASLADATGQVVVSSRPESVGRPAPAHHEAVARARTGARFDADSREAGGDALLLVLPVLGEPEAPGAEPPLLGTLAMRFSTARMNAAMWRSAVVSAVFVLLGAAGIGLSLYWVLMRSTLRPVEMLLIGVERMGSGDLAARVRRRDLGVLRGVGDALNAMWEGFASLASRVTGITARMQEGGERLGAALRSIEDGSHTQEGSAEETASMLVRVNQSIRSVNKQIEDLSRSTEEASSSTLELAASVDEVARSVSSLNDAVESSSSSSQEMSASIRQVAESADEVQRMAEETAASMTQMDRAIREVGDHVSQASELTEKVAQGAEDGSQAVKSTIDGIQEIRSLTGDAKEVIERLVGRIGEIGEILNVIGEINDETNLLSLNAAIIAAQAGEQGKAFAVVANHVKTLAQRTAQSTQEIERLIRSVQDESGNAVTAMETGMNAVETGVERSRRAGEALASIRQLAAEANARVSEIARAAQEQGRNSKHVADAANRTSAMVQKISTAMAEQNRASEQMLQTSEAALVVCRQVQRSTEEQRQSTAFITESISAIGEMMRSLQENMSRHQQAGETVSQVVQRVVEVARDTGAKVPEVMAIVDEMRREAEALQEEIARFRPDAEGAVPPAPGTAGGPPAPGADQPGPEASRPASAAASPA